jgi:hypothetical protein
MDLISVTSSTRRLACHWWNRLVRRPVLQVTDSVYQSGLRQLAATTFLPRPPRYEAMRNCSQRNEGECTRAASVECVVELYLFSSCFD